LVRIPGDVARTRHSPSRPDHKSTRVLNRPYPIIQ
jgi:hypothetical protein